MPEKTVEFARAGHGFSHTRRGPSSTQVLYRAAGPVEGTFNLIGRAIGELATAVALETETDIGTVIEAFDGASSIKAWIDIDWSDVSSRADARQRLLGQFETLWGWLAATLET